MDEGMYNDDLKNNNKAIVQKFIENEIIDAIVRDH